MPTFKYTKNILATMLLLAVAAPYVPATFAQEVAPSSDESETGSGADYDYYQKYLLYEKYKKKKKYKEYKEYKEKYAFDSQAERLEYKDAYAKYKLFKKEPLRYRQYASLYDKYKRYRNYKNKYAPVKKYSKYKKYDKKEYDKYKKYGSSTYKAGHDRYLAYLSRGGTNYGEANLGGGALGPEISVGLVAYTKSDLSDSYFRVKAYSASSGNPLGYVVKNTAGAVVATINADTYTKVKWNGSGNFKVYESVPDTIVSGDVLFDAPDGNTSDYVFDINRPDSSFDRYRGKMKLHYYDSPDADGDRIWAINTLPMEHYVYGMGEITGTGDEKYNRTMTISYRTYGYWKARFSTKYAAQGFKVNATPGNQLYYGYDWEMGHLRIRDAAQYTAGVLMMHQRGNLNEIAITPYSSWTDGRTRSFEERWGSKEYPWCQSVADPYGKHPTMDTASLEAAGNHMVGLSAHGALSLAKDHGWEYHRILGYYYSAINLLKAY
ncbi:MAG TPA: hypothetical protein PKA31_03020 [Candidatus Moranbacteria bacterium]|nr:hypothetical protein [Candidatus Moranbacteria bacterium]